MLRLPMDYTEDEKANIIIAVYLNQNLLNLVTDVVDEYEKVSGCEAKEDDAAFCNFVSTYFPENYPEEKMGREFLGLRALLESEYEFVPDLAMEYAMYRLFTERIETADDLGQRTMEPIAAGRDYVIQVLKAENPDESEQPPEDDEDADMFISWQEMLEQLEDLHNYDYTYFWDADYLELDYYTEEELANSPMAEYMGIDVTGNRGKKFIVPPEWLKVE